MGEEEEQEVEEGHGCVQLGGGAWTGGGSVMLTCAMGYLTAYLGPGVP
jgi:hypothetical protein